MPPLCCSRASMRSGSVSRGLASSAHGVRPKEAAGADFGVAGCPDGFIVFKKGAFVCRGSMDEFEQIVAREFAELLNQ